MNQEFQGEQTLDGEQLLIIRELVGDAVAREDLPALAGAYRDFRAGMDSLKAACEQLGWGAEQEVTR